MNCTTYELDISICVPTYNHEKYIGRALDSILMQECTYQYQIVIGEDCSTDNTREIVEQYRTKYPEKFKILYREKNIGMRENLNELLLECNGKYVAKLEGDDYWTDKKKLQKQVDFLENNNDFISCAHNVHIVDENGNIREDMPDYFWNNYVYSLDDYREGYEKLGGHTASLVYRNIFKDMPEKRLKAFLECPINEDQRLNLYLAIEGKKYILSDYMASWMVTRGGG